VAGAEEANLLRDGDRVLLIDNKDRRYLLTLRSGTSFHTHAGIVVHDDLIGRPEGSSIAASTGRRFVAVRPTLSDLILKMPRGAQVIYPKDLGSILMEADIGPGMRVLESGVGSGALSMALLRAGADVVGYELRDDFAARASRNVAELLGETGRYRVEIKNVYDGIAARGLDRILLDVPEPWRVLDHAVEAMRSGGILCAYLPTINQTSELRYAIERGPFGLARTVEILQRTWHVEPRSVRPDHRMVGHTGFLTTARLLLSEPEDPPKR
jgi:tRNA (adenine57-N1/adenine58-N1)-methyltransferase catalytic subunit